MESLNALFPRGFFLILLKIELTLKYFVIFGIFRYNFCVSFLQSLFSRTFRIKLTNKNSIGPVEG